VSFMVASLRTLSVSGQRSAVSGEHHPVSLSPDVDETYIDVDESCIQ
jgi:hypothetical protein